MISATWGWLWEKHDQVKDMFRFFVKPEDAIEKNKVKKPDVTKSGYGGKGNGGKRPYTNAQITGLILGPLLFILLKFILTFDGLSSEGQAILASTAWIATWWVTEAIPIPATSLLPIILFPLAGGLDMKATTSAYGNDTIFLFLGGFVLALAMERWDLHRRIAINIISVMGTRPDRIVLGFMVATGFLSMWISNTATAMMMIPIGLAITYQVQDALKDNPKVDTSKGNFSFGKAIMLGIGYSASIGGMATLIGTPPNAILAGTLRELFGYEISFAGWMLFGVPFAWILLFFAWFYLTKMAFPTELKDLPGGKAIFDQEKEKLGKASYEEKAVFIVFVLTALSWITRTFVLEKINPNIDDTVIAILAAIVLFLIPTKSTKASHIMDWSSAVKLPWGVLLLFGGGLSIAAGFTTSGLSEWIGSQLIGLQGVHIILIILAVTALVNALTEVTSNTATATMMYPIMAALALAVDVHPLVLMVAAGLSASCAFMLPVATPPNAVVFGTGYMRIVDMAKAGFFLNIASIILITLTCYYVLPAALGIDITVFPDSFK
ncbi:MULTISPECIES: SLC13 family permease [Oceanobacillus]|uniref:Sodium-dependent dicarboxylate transporter SdcS n=1 Tax=Oceanobacillus indicireducens TaxID=1004261 RepID=A0A917XZA2_9BACI|nr:MULTISPECIES: DASS family sodium-coupled anion symporter [Oceanobacillus]GGN60762.1 sodium-dependent dicarboxylate transporter SdcS [Oceanobacillus indicireducens]